MGGIHVSKSENVPKVARNPRLLLMSKIGPTSGAHIWYSRVSLEQISYSRTTLQHDSKAAAPSSLLVDVSGAVEEPRGEGGGALLAVGGLRHEESGERLLAHGRLVQQRDEAAVRPLHEVADRGVVEELDVLPLDALPHVLLLCDVSVEMVEIVV